MINVDDLRIRDPFVFVEDGKYYLLGTSGNDSWGRGSDLTLYTSSDLKELEVVGTMVDAKYLEGYTNIWAPELHKYNGKYYLILSLFSQRDKRGSIIFVSSSLKEQFVPLTGEYITPKGWVCLDASLFVYNGTPYLYFSNEWIDAVNNDGDGSLFVVELSKDLKEIVGQPKKVVGGANCGFSKAISNGVVTGYVAEGPFVLEENGKIVLYWSTFCETGYCVVKSVADSVMGEYVFDKFIFTDNGGHCMVYDDLGGNKKITFHQPNNSPDERMKIFDLE